jgi:hypothetical protein
MAKRESVSAVEFVKVFTPMAKQGKSALEIGKALGVKGTAEQVAQFVSIKASQIRKRLKIEAARLASERGLSPEETNTLVAEMGNRLPRLKSAAGRKANVGEVVAAIDAVLAELNG